MPQQKPTIFRKESLERQTSPNKIDRPMQIVRSTEWIALGGFSIFIVLGLLWSIFGRIPITITGEGALIPMHRVLNIQASKSGKLKSVNVRDGQCIQAGHALATLDLYQDQTRLRLLQNQLAQLQIQDADAQKLAQQRIKAETIALTQQRISLEKRLQTERLLTPTLYTQGMAAVAKQRQSMQQQVSAAKQLLSIFKKRLGTRKSFFDNGAATKDDEAIAAEQEYIQAQQTVANLESQMQQINISETNIQQRHLDNIKQIQELEAQLQTLDSQKIRVVQEQLDTENNRKNQIRAVQQQIAQLQEEIDREQQVISPGTGCIVEITVQPGQVVQPGTAIAIMDLPSLTIVDKSFKKVPNSSQTLLGITYFDDKDGKRIQPGMEIQITPTTVERERYGGIVGKVVYVSRLPVTNEGVNATVGNPEFAKKLVPPGTTRIQVVSQLLLNQNSSQRLKWSSSKGPNIEISSGVTTTARVAIEERAPITYIIPLLRE